MTGSGGSQNLPAVGNGVVNILLVDDEVRNLDVLESILASPNHRLVRAQTAQEALMTLIDGDFAAIVLDIQMPGTNGLELAHLIKQRKRTQHIPIIFLTAYFQEDKDIIQGYEVGAVDYLTKPIDSKILKSKIAVFVELFQKNRELAVLNSAMESEIARREKAEQALRQANNELEARVEERTAKLTQAIDDLCLSNTAVLESEQRYRQIAAIVESSDDAIISKNLNGIITSWNRGAERIFGYQANEVVGKPITILIPAERWDEEPNILDRIRRGEHMDHYETIRQRKDGSLIEISLTVSPIKDANGKIIGASKIGRDITQQKQAERELERLHKEAVAASRAKDDFLAALSHELRTPLNPVLLLASDSAENPELPAEIRAQFATIRNNVELEARLIDDLLDITRITHGKLSLNTAPLDVHAVLQEAIATVRSELDQKQISLSLKLAEEKPVMQGDTVRLQQVFWNVLKNAVKFNSEGGKIIVETSIFADGKKIAVKIIDTGIGLTAHEISRIFNAFSQGDHAGNEDSHRFGGLGLGLSISRMLVELHSGSIHATSTGRDQGATFVIELPLVRSHKQNDGSTPSAPPAKNGSQIGSKKKSGMRILLGL